MLEWMAWTTPVAVFFSCIVLMLVGMTVWELKSPTRMRRGFLPLDTTRGDRLFIGLLSAAYVNLIFVGISGKLAGWLGLAEDPSIWISFVLSMALLAWIMRKG
jgi:predicted small integral membrane protein